MSISSLIWSPAPYHIISYGTLLGSEIFQSFIAGIISFRALPRPQFATLQSALFPIYFSMQTALPLLLALTYPAPSSSLTTSQVVKSNIPSSLSGVLHPSNRAQVLVPLALTFLCGLANMLVIGPATTRTMKERKHQETRDGKKSYDAGPHSVAMQGLNKRFAWLHGASSLVNLVGCLATIWYGFYLGGRML